MQPAARFLAAFTSALLALAVFAGAALAHAELLRSKPAGGQMLERSPRSFVLTFDEAIDTEFVQLRVTDSAGRRVDRGAAHHPGGREELVAVRLRRGLEGTLTASYRVISEDGHPVGKRTSFRVEPPEQMGAPAPSKQGSKEGSMQEPGPAMREEAQAEHAQPLTGPVTDAAFAAARGLGYLSVALAIGGVVFMMVVWLPALSRLATAGAEWRATSERFVAPLKWIVVGAVALGLVATALAIVLEAATVAGVSFWAALDPDVIEPITDTRVVEAWGLRLLVWMLLGALLLRSLRWRRAPMLRRAALGAEGSALGPNPSRVQALLLIAAAAALATTAAMASHSWTESPRALLIGADVVHVLSMSAWVGGLVMLLLAVRVARRHLPPGDSTSLLAQVVGLFSRLAIVVVALIIITGAIQSIVLVGSLPAFVETAHGRLVLAKIALMVLLLALGAYNQRRSLPRLRKLAEGRQEPGRAAAILRRAVAAEVALVLVVIGVTSVLVAASPAGG